MWRQEYLCGFIWNSLTAKGLGCSMLMAQVNKVNYRQNDPPFSVLEVELKRAHKLCVMKLGSQWRSLHQIGRFYRRAQVS